MKMQQRLNRQLARIDALSLRERGMLLVGAFMVLFLLWDSFLMSDTSRNSKLATQKIAEVQDRIAQLNGSLTKIAQLRGIDPNAQLQQELASSKAQLARLDHELAQRSGTVIPPQEMARVVEQIMKRQGKLKLISAQSLPARPLFDTTEEEDDLGTVYQHGLELEVEGRYLDVLEYLRELETLDWRFFWEAIELDSDDYPKNRVRIRIFSVNLEEGWLGV